MDDLIRASGFRADALGTGYMKRPVTLDLHVSGFGNEVTSNPPFGKVDVLVRLLLGDTDILDMLGVIVGRERLAQFGQPLQLRLAGCDRSDGRR
jgi:hypothetical protein